MTTSAPEGSAPPNDPLVGNYYFLPKAKVQIDGTPGEKGAAYTIAISQTNEPDRNHRYFVRYKGSTFSEDTYTLAVDAKGLLQTVNLQSEDKSPAIINKLADTVVSVLSADANAAGMNRNAATEPFTERPFSVGFDPQSTEEVSNAQAVVTEAGFLLTIDPIPPNTRRQRQPSRGDKEIATPRTLASSSEVRQRASEGVFFHPPTTVTLTISPKTRARVLLTKPTEIRIPDKHQLAIFDLRRLPLVKRTTNLAFSEGMLTNVGETRPSQTLAIVTIPADLAGKAAAAIPAIIKIQNETANAGTIAETARLKAQTDLLSQETARLKAQAALAQQVKGGGTTSNGDAASAALQHAQAENARAQTELIRTKEQSQQQSPTTPSDTNTSVSPSPPPHENR